MGGERRAILVGCGEFTDPNLIPLRCPANDVRGLHGLLAGEAQGNYYRDVLPLTNEPHHKVLRSINLALRNAKKDDFVLLYYSGHGKLDLAGHLYLAASDTEVEALESTSIPVREILHWIATSACRNFALILDCCYSGAVGVHLRGGVEDQLQQASSSAGLYILTASTGTQAAEEKEKDDYGLLTKYVIQGIETGDADPGDQGRISMDDLYEYVHPKVRQEGFQEPMKFALGVKGELLIARSGKSPREEQRKRIGDMLLEYATAGSISYRLLSEALRVLSLTPDELQGDLRERYNLLKRLLHKQLGLGEFIDEWYALNRGTSGPIWTPGPPSPKRENLPVARVDNYITIPAGTFLMGAQREDPNGPNYDPEAYDSEAPVHEVVLKGFRIARFPTTVQEFAAFIKAGGYQTRRYWVDGFERSKEPPENWAQQQGYPDWPVVGVSWYEAAAYCAWAGGRLPTEAEWERAARGPQGTRYPWGNEPPLDPYRANYHAKVGHPTPVGRYPLGQTAEGVNDMLGNVWEWCSDWFGPYSEGRQEDPAGPKNGDVKTTRGGSWVLSPRFVRASVRVWYGPTIRLPYIGFRCGGELR